MLVLRDPLRSILFPREATIFIDSANQLLHIPKRGRSTFLLVLRPRHSKIFLSVEVLHCHPRITRPTQPSRRGKSRAIPSWTAAVTSPLSSSRISSENMSAAGARYPGQWMKSSGNCERVHAYRFSNTLNVEIVTVHGNGRYSASFVNADNAPVSCFSRATIIIPSFVARYKRDHGKQRDISHVHL